MRLRRHGWWIIALAVFATVALLRAGGYLRTFEFAASDARARLLSHRVESNIVIVGIDAQSLAALDTWPWPRRHHAALIDQIARASPESLFFDIDFSSQSNALDDAVLEAALARWPGEPVRLPAFLQAVTAADATPVTREPLARFASHARLVSVNRRSGIDGLERTWPSSWKMNGRSLRSVIDLDGVLPAESSVPIDYSIAPDSFAYVSYVDVLRDHVPADALRGRDVYVGATAVELGDMVPVPVHRSLPGVVVQALATESVRAGVLRELPAWLFLMALAAWTLLSAALLRAQAWRRNLLLLAGASVLIAGSSVYAFAAARTLIDIVPFAFATFGVFLAVTLRSLDQQTWRAVTYALGMRRRDALLKSIVHSSTDCIVCVDETGVIQTANPAAGRLFACPAGELVGAPIARFIPGLAASSGATGGPFPELHGAVTEWEGRSQAGQCFPVELAVSRVRLHSERLYTAIVRDISERKAQQQALEYQATHDSLTRLPNRAALMRRLEAAIAGDQRPRPVTLLMLDLCRFKEVNDTLGHNVGDQVLCEVARRFHDAASGKGFIARIGGDEFTVLIERPGDQATVTAIAKRFGDCLRAPIDVAGISIEVGLSVGIARCPQDADDAVTLLKRADVAMYEAKRRGLPFENYQAEQDGNTVRRLSLGGELRAAIFGNALELHFQPQVNLRSGRAEGVEALLRWHHPGLGAIGPGEFVAIAESTDLIRPLTEWALTRAMVTSEEWRARGCDLRIAANLSARLLQDIAFPDRLRTLLRSTGARAAALELEITESAMMLDPARALGIIREIASLGVRIAIDDFGTGYSSLGYLRDLPVHSLKLDKSFVQGMRNSPDDRIIVESTAQMAQALQLELVAEGVEDEWAANFLRGAGYDFAQGYLYSPALPAERCAEWIREFNAAAAVADGKPATVAAFTATSAGTRRRRR